MALANASMEGSSEPRSMSHAAKTHPEEAEGRSVDEAETVPTRSATRETSDTDAAEGSGGERWVATKGTTEGTSSPATATTVATAATSTGVSVAVASSADGYLRQSAVGTSARNGGSESSAIEGADVPSANSAAVRVPVKQDRTKAQTDVKDVSSQTTADVAVVNQSKIPVVTMVSWQGTAHGQGGEASGSSAKNAASENSTGTGGKPTASLDGTADGTASTANVSSGVTGFELGIPVQAPAEVFEAGLDGLNPSGLSTNSELTSNAEGGQATDKSMQKSAAAIDDSGDSKTDGVSSTKSVSGAAGGTSSQAVASGIQTLQSFQGDPSKAGPGVNAPRAAENGAVQTPMQTALTHAVPREGGAAPQRAASGTPDTAHAGKAQDLPASAHLAGGESAATSGINSAKLIQTMGETEMHVGMHSEEFGDISIRTSVSQQQMMAQISLDHNDLSQALSAHLSTMQTKLGEEYGLHASIEINNQGAPLSGGQGNSSQSDQQPSARSSRGKSAAPAALSESVSGAVALTSAGSGHGLDIRV